MRVRGKQVEEMHGKDIRNSEELKSQKQTLHAKLMDENNETFKHDAEFHEFRTAVAAGADLQHERVAKEVTQSSPRPSGKASSSTSTSLGRPVRTTQFSQRRRWSPAVREECDKFAARDGYQQDNVHKEVMHDIKQLQDGLDVTSGTDVFRTVARSRRQQSTETRTRRTSRDTQHADSQSKHVRC